MSPVNFIIIFSIINFCIILFYKNISKFINVYDSPSTRKIHKNNVPLIGGYIILFNYLIFFLIVQFNFLDFKSINLIFESKSNLTLLFLFSFLVFLIGAIDDKFDLNPNLKLIILSFLIILILNFDSSLHIKNLRFSFYENEIHLGVYSQFFTLICFLLFINACNMFDGINLQSCSYFLIIFTSIFIIFSKSIFIIFIIIALITIFILNYNGKIFMGDSGVYLFSFILSFIIIKQYNFNDAWTADFIFILMMVPGIDMLRLFVLRIYNKKNPFRADKKHIHHFLLDKFSYKKTILILNGFIILPIYLGSTFNYNIVIISLYILIQFILFKYIFLTSDISKS